MTRRWILRWLAAAGGALAAFACRPLSVPAQQVPNLTQTLRSVLKCRRPEEFAFVDLVVSKVNLGVLPEALVLSMMKWARERRDDIPFPYFQEGIRRRAKALGVEL